MTVPPRPPIPSLLPESAPFSPEQRTWLNGFFAGLLSLDGGTPLSAEDAAALMPGLGAAASGPPGDGDDGAAPWHDQGLPLAERMKLAEGRPLRRRMMAAMAQQDCGQCGYNCEDYSSAIVLETEERLNLCVPGGKETARMVKKLYEELAAAPPQPAAEIAAPVAAADVATPDKAAAAAGRWRDHPVPATLVSATRPNRPGSEKGLVSRIYG